MPDEGVTGEAEATTATPPMANATSDVRRATVEIWGR